MDSDFENTFVTITDEDGKEYNLELYRTIEINGKLYYVLIDDVEDYESTDPTFIMRAEEENGEESLICVYDEDELLEVYTALANQIHAEIEADND